MASVTLAGGRFPPTTSVSVYRASDLPKIPTGAPAATAVTSATTDAVGAVAFTGLAPFTHYFAYAAGLYVAFFTESDSVYAQVELRVSLPLVVNPNDVVDVATMNLDPGLYQLTIGIVGDAAADPTFLGAFALGAFPVPAPVGHELGLDGAVNFGGVMGLASVGGGAEADHSDSGSRAFMARVATTFTVRVDATGTAGGTLKAITLAAVRIA